MVFLGFALVGLALAGVNAVHPRRPFVVLFLVYAVVCVGSFVTPGSPLGNNIGRFFMVFGLPLLLLLRHTRLRRPFRYGELAIIPIVLFALLQFGTATSHFLNAVERPQTTPRVLRPGARPPPRTCTTPTTASTSSRCAATGRRCTSPRPATPSPAAGTGRRTPSTTASSTRPTTPPSTSRGCRAWAWSTSSRRWRGRWTRGAGARRGCWRARRPSPSSSRPAPGASTGCATPSRSWCRTRRRPRRPAGPRRRRGRSASSGTSASSSRVTRPGTYWLKVTSSPYWELEGPGTVHPRPDRFMDLRLRRSGTYTLRFVVTPSKALDVMAGRFGL